MANKDAPTKLLTKVAAVIHFQRETYEQVKAHLDIIVNDYLSIDSESYGCIIHDKDVDDDGKIKVIHIHFVFRLRKRCRKSTIINKLASLAEVNTLAVSVDGASSFEGCFQYLIHKNDPNKFQYSIDDVVTNLGEGEIDIIMDSKSVALDLPSLKAACLGSEDLVEIIEFVGLSTYQHYRATILDVFNWAQDYRRKEREQILKGGAKNDF